MLNGAIIGCGFFAANHLNAWRDIEREGGRARLVAVCDVDRAKAEAAAREFGIGKVYTDAEAMMAAETLDFVDVATTPQSHRALVELAARHKVPVICQKPMAQSLDDCKAMVAACDGAGVPFMVHENFRFQAPLLMVRATMDAGTIGTPFFGRISFRTAHDIFKGQPYLATFERFILDDVGVHVFDVARYLFGEVRQLTCTTRRVNPDIRGEDTATALFLHEGGATSVVDLSYWSKREPDAFPQTLIEVDGAAGSIRLTQDYRMTVTGADGTTTHDVDAAVLPWAHRPWHVVQDSVLATQRHWVECLESGREPDTSGRDNLLTLKLVEGGYRSAAEGRTIDPSTL